MAIAGTSLDGEVFAGRGRFSEVMSTGRSFGAGDAAWRRLEFVVFDAPEAPGGFEARLAAARAAVAAAPHARCLAHAPCKGAAHLQAELDRITEDRTAAGGAPAGEGVMLRKPGSRYSGGRSHDLLKVKKSLDDEAVVVGYKPGKGRLKGMTGAVECRAGKFTGGTFFVGTGFSDAQRRDPPKVNAVITFSYFETTKAGVPRFPAFERVRPDVSAAAVLARGYGEPLGGGGGGGGGGAGAQPARKRAKQG